MKNPILVLALCATAACFTGCKPAAEDSSQTTSKELERAKSDTAAAAQEMKDYAFEQKAEFVAKMQTRLDEINRDLSQLSARIEKSSDRVKAEAEPKLKALRAQAGELGKQIEAARSANGSTWDAVKADSRKAYDSLKDGCNQARQWLSEKIAP